MRALRAPILLLPESFVASRIQPGKRSTSGAWARLASSTNVMRGFQVSGWCVLETRIPPLASDVLEHFLRREFDRHLADPADAAIVVEGQLAGAEVLGDATE